MKREPSHTQIGQTDTLDGTLPHLRIVHEDGVLLAPVKLVTDTRNCHGLCEPMRRGEKLVYALPGGSEMEALP